MRTLIVVFGAAVWAGGRASPTLARRTRYALAAARADPSSALFLSGAEGRFPPSEARVMASLIGDAVPPDRLHLDEASRDTLQTVLAATAYAHAGGHDRIVACTDRYHLPRVLMLFRLCGLRAEPLRFARADLASLSTYRRRMALREAAALPYDLVAGLWALRRAGR
ncbi:DUF218 domain-containing protein [Sphingomonas guangdongensis]|uniref:DUF218 domain-containing protein n=1 Tax=Sphingomonas guangdongensis TaxID=1141890 RepID=A0A285QJU0_9SPHN|nr:YdcF family protein [Sphingomonas guangdongensis]SOB80407.1 DUF218 domain-containing protein [Sphingomonas guangdongensis]